MTASIIHLRTGKRRSDPQRPSAIAPWERLKRCYRCKRDKPTTNFYKSQKCCKSCTKETRKEWENNNPEKYKAQYQRNNIKKRGITLDQKKKLLTKQFYRCAICSEKNLEINKFHTDHCHKTNKIRGLLCRRCNLAIGAFEDSVDLLQRAINYLGANT